MTTAKERLLLHVCCGPCSTAVIQRLLPRFDVTLFFANPNLFPEEEYRRRLDAARRVAERCDLRLSVAEDDHGAWLDAVRGMEWEPEGGSRCDVCFQVRLEDAACAAEAGGFELFATTLTISPHKDVGKVSRAGRRATMNRRVRFLDEDFKKRDGFRKSVALSREMGLYRQTYCGCEYSIKDRK